MADNNGNVNGVWKWVAGGLFTGLIAIIGVVHASDMAKVDSNAVAIKSVQDSVAYTNSTVAKNTQAIVELGHKADSLHVDVLHKLEVSAQWDRAQMTNQDLIMDALKVPTWKRAHAPVDTSDTSGAR